MLKKMLSAENPVTEDLVPSSESGKILLSDDQRLQFEEQIRMFIQLLTQFYLLSCRDLNELNSINESSKRILVELKRIASEYNIFNACNLTGALNIVNEFEKMKEYSRIPKRISSTIGQTMVNSKVFIYPELLPRCCFNTRVKFQKVTFTEAEDNLIALGLERFSGESDPVHQIYSHLMPCKKVSQLKIRIKNRKASNAPKDNAVKYYYAHKIAPPMPRSVKIFDPNNVKAPKDYPYKDLPEWMIRLISKSSRSMNEKILPHPVKRVSEPSFILPKFKMAIVQNNSVFQSSEEFDVMITSCDIQIKKKHSNKNEAKKNKYKPPFILPKTILRNNERLHSDLRDIPDLESNGNNNSKNESKQDYLLKNDVTKSFDVCDNKNGDDANDMGKTQNIHKPLVILNNKSSEYNGSELIIKNEPMTGHSVVFNNKGEINSIVDFKIDESQSKAASLIINDNKSSEKICAKNVNKPSAALGRVVKELLLKVNDDSNKKKEFNSYSSTNLNDIKYHDQPVIGVLNNENNAFSPKKQKHSATVDYFPDPSGKECGIIIKSEIVEEEEDESVSIKDFADSKTPDSSVFSVNEINLLQANHTNFKGCKLNLFHSNGGVNQNLSNLENVKALPVVNDKNFLAENTSKNNVSIRNLKRIESLHDKCIDGIISNTNSNLQAYCEFKRVQTNRSKKSSINNQNSNFVENAIENINIQNFTPSEASKTIPSQCANHIKQEITDDFEIVQSYVSVTDVDINKSDANVKPEINGEKSTEDIPSTLNSNHIIKTIDYFQCSNDEECDIIIKSEIIEENIESEDACKTDFNLERVSHVDCSSSTKDYKESLRKRNLRSVNYCNLIKKRKTLHDNSNALNEFSTLAKKPRDLPLIQKIKSNDKKATTYLSENVNAYKKDISIKSEIIQDNQTFLQGISCKIFNKPILKATKSVVKSNSLEKAHLKKSNKRVKQIRKKQNYQTKRKLRKRT